MPRSCVFCGSMGSLSREHVFGQWVSRIGLDASPVGHMAGPLNRIPRQMGVQPPYRQTVRNVCSRCNNGWMSRLEATAQRVLTPLILGEPASIDLEDQAAIAQWAQKTALTSMLLSSEQERKLGYGLPDAEYRALYAVSESMRPLPDTSAWVGRYDGDPGFWAVRVTPLTVQIAGMPELEWPHAYAATVVLGQLVVQLVRFTTPALRMDMTSSIGMSQLWPVQGPVTWPSGRPCTSGSFQRFADGALIETGVSGLELKPWGPAAQLEQSTIKNGLIEVPAVCGEHVLRFPPALIAEAMRGRFYAFISACECPMAYLMQTKRESTNFKAAGDPLEISAMYEELDGEEFVYEDAAGSFVCKRIPAGRGASA